MIASLVTREFCLQCSAKLKVRLDEMCNFMGTEFDYYVLDCHNCGKTIVDQSGSCCAFNCKEAHGGRWHLTFTLPGVFLKVHDPKTGQSLVGKDEDVG